MILSNLLDTKKIVNNRKYFITIPDKYSYTNHIDNYDPGTNQDEDTPLPYWNFDIIVNQFGVCSLVEGVGFDQNHYDDLYSQH